jgi:copper homeostasis protein CutC
MDTHQILQAVKAEISRLQKVVDLLEGGTTPSPKAVAATATPKHRGLSTAARKRISKAQKARWAKVRASKKEG